jgi:hypothetical protein
MNIRHVLFACMGIIILLFSIAVSAQNPQSYTIPDGTRIQAKLETALSTKSIHQGDRFVTRVHDPVLLNGKEVIPIGTVIEGRVAEIKRPGKGRTHAEMNLAYERMILPNGVSFTIVATQADLDENQKATIDRKEGTLKGPSTAKRDAAEVGGGAAVGAGIGAAAGGGQGAAIGAGIGSVVGLIDTIRRKGNDIELQAGTRLVIRLERPVTIQSTRQQF